MKVAVFIAGPYRYAPMVQESLKRILGAIEYDVFFHIWKEDLGNKRRIEIEEDYARLAEDNKTKLLLLARPYNEDDYSSQIGIQTNSGSSINATMGMFIAMNVLSNYLELLPDSSSYTHIFRLRTDCIFFDSIEDKVWRNRNNILVSNNFFIPPNWISDHIMFAPKKKFYKFWRFGNMNCIYDAYKNGQRSPEKTLEYLGSGFTEKIVKLFSRDLDYHIIYNPPKEETVEQLRRIISEKGVKYLFDNIGELKERIKINEDRYSELVENQKKLNDHLTRTRYFRKYLSEILRMQN